MRTAGLPLVALAGLLASGGCGATPRRTPAGSGAADGARVVPLSPGEARQTALDFVHAFNSGHPATMARFGQRHAALRGPRPPADEATARYQQQRRHLGALRVHGIEVGADRAVIRAEALDDGWVDVTLFFAPDSSTTLTGRRISPAPPPIGAADRPASGGAIAPQQAADVPLAQRVERYVNALAARDLFSGVVLVADGDTVLLQRAHGLADRDAKRSNTVDTKFDIASLSKMFTAAAVLQMVEAGKVKLESPLADYLPDYPNPSVRDRTIRALLTHTSGLGDFFGPRYEAARLSLLTPQDFIALAGADPPAFSQGTGWRYSNLGFVVLGRVVESASGLAFDDYLRARLFRPAGMNDTDAYPLAPPLLDRAIPYTHRRSDGRWVPERRWSATPHSLPKGSPSGGHLSTGPDLLKFARALLRNQILPARATTEMLAGKVKIPAGGAENERYAYGFTEAWTRGVRHVGHTGETLGVSAAFDVFPDTGRVVVVLSNYDGPLGSWVAARIVEWTVEELEGRRPGGRSAADVPDAAGDASGDDRRQP